MALADSVPGVSGGTIAFILGFYDRFINALHALFQGSPAERKDACLYLFKLGIGWVLGMGACVILLSNLFEQNIYFMSSLFLGLTVCSIPFVAAAEQQALKNWHSCWFLLLGAAVPELCNLPASRIPAGGRAPAGTGRCEKENGRVKQNSLALDFSSKPGCYSARFIVFDDSAGNRSQSFLSRQRTPAGTN